jgi:hypothetical protein
MAKAEIFESKTPVQQEKSQEQKDLDLLFELMDEQIPANHLKRKLLNTALKNRGLK